MMTPPLRYRISDWHQLIDVVSNNSRDLFITVTDFVQDNRLNGTRICIEHKAYGTLFACIVNPHGSIISYSEEPYSGLEPTQITSMLEMFGFLVNYVPTKSLPGDLISFLMTLKGLDFDKIRVLSVWKVVNGVKAFNDYVIAFNISNNPDWINNGYSASEAEFLKAIQEGSAISVSALSSLKHWDWSWLNYVANIDDILDDNVQ